MKTLNIWMLCCIAGLVSSCISADGPTEKVFKAPPNQYYPMPFWHMNGLLTTTELKEQLDKSYNESGFGGVAVLPVSPGTNWKDHSIVVGGTRPDFLTDAYFDRYEDILKISKAAGKEVILYDDEDFPSGIAGGKMKELYPADLRKRLDKQEQIITSGTAVEMTVPPGKLMAAVAMDTITLERINLTRKVKSGILKWTAPKGTWRVMLFACVLDDDPVVDYMDTTAVNKFIALTYDKYAERFSSYFGNTIKSTFIDDVGYVFRSWGWTNEFNNAFLEINGYSPETYYPALWYNIGSRTEAVRVAFHNTRAELLAEGFPRKVSEWNVRNNLVMTGHPPGNYEACPVDMQFDIFKFYRHMQQPLMDMIHGYTYGRPGYKLISSAADYYGRNIVAAEAYGNFREKFDKKLMYRAIMELFTRGVNFVIPHGMWYTYHPDSVRIMPLISAYNPDIASDLKSYSDYVARCCYMLQQGYRVADIGILYPIHSLQGWYQFTEHASMRGDRIAPEIDYYRLSDLFTQQLHRDFTFIHPLFFKADEYQVSGTSIQLNNKDVPQTYKLIVLPGGDVFSLEAMKKLKAYYDSGGKVLATTKLPTKSAEIGRNKELQALVKEVFATTAANAQGGKSFFVADPNVKTMEAAFDTLGVSASVSFFNNPVLASGRGELSYIHRVAGDCNIYFVANSSDEALHTKMKIPKWQRLSLWNPDTGEITPIRPDYIIDRDGECVEFALHLDPVQSHFIIGRPLD